MIVFAEALSHNLIYDDSEDVSHKAFLDSSDIFFFRSSVGTNNMQLLLENLLDHRGITDFDLIAVES